MSLRIHKLLFQHSEKAAEVLGQILETGSDADKVRAAKVIFDFSLPKPAQHTIATFNAHPRPNFTKEQALKYAEMQLPEEH